MLTGAVDSLKGLLMKQTYKSMSVRNLSHHIHGQLVVIHRYVGGIKDRRKLMLAGSHFIMLCLCRNSQLPKLLVQLMHISCDSGLQGTEVMILHLLSLGRFCAQKGSAGKYQVSSLFKCFFFHQEIFLFGSHCSGYTGNLLIAENMKNLGGLSAQCLHGTKQWCFLIKCLSAVRAERSRYVQSAILDKSRGSRIPCGISSCLKGSSQTTGGEAGSIRFTLYQLFAGELHDDFSTFHGRDEAVMLLCRKSCHRLEPMGKMRCSVFHCPFLHGDCHCICHIYFQMRIRINSLSQCLVNILGKLIPHNLIIKN